MNTFYENIFQAFGDPLNPVYTSLLIILTLFGTIYFFFKYYVNPLRQKHNKEKENLELKNAKMMALFAELDPDPIIRVDKSGEIFGFNNAASRVFNEENLLGKKIKDLNVTIDLPDQENFEATQNFESKIGNRFYKILYRGDANLNIAHLYFRDFTDLKNYEEELLEYQTKLKSLTEHLYDKIENERRSIAAGLHDSIGQSLSLMQIKFLHLLEKEKDSPHYTTIENFVVSLESIIRELKGITYSLRPKLLDELGLITSLRNLAKKVEEDIGIKAELNTVGVETRLEEKLELTIYRIAQESINNIVKHSKATNFSIQIIYSNKYITLIVTDNGIGMDEDALHMKNNMGMGLMNIKERVESYNGNIKIESFSYGGTMIYIELPITKKEE